MMETDSEIHWLESSDLNLQGRFDIIVKLRYARASLRDQLTSAHRQMYVEHIRAFNHYFEPRDSGAPKTSPDDFVGDFDKLIHSMKSEGFDSSHPIVVGPDNTPRSGAHRTAAALALGLSIPATRHPEPLRGNWGYKFFVDRGMPQADADFAARALLERFPNLRAAVLFGAAHQHWQAIEDSLSSVGDIHYSRTAKLSALGCDNLIRVLYEGERWLGRKEFGYLGAASKAKPCFPKEAPRSLRLVLFNPDGDDADLREAKERARDLVGVGNHSIHMTDSTEETVRIADWLLNANARHLLNNKRFRHFLGFENDLGRLSDELKTTDGFETHCVVGSSVLSAYGLRDARDLDVVVAAPSKRADDSNSHWQSHGFNIRELVFSPTNHFRFRGIKFVSLERVAELKRRRAEPKDEIDLRLIDSVLRSDSGLVGRLHRLALLGRLYTDRRFVRSFVGHWLARFRNRARR